MKIEDMTIGQVVSVIIIVIAVSMGLLWVWGNKPGRMIAGRNYDQTPVAVSQYLAGGDNISPNQALIRLTEKVQMLEMRIENMEKSR